MRVPFRQGLLSFQKIASTPTFLQQSATNASFVSHVVEPTPTVIVFAHGTSDYLHVVDSGIDLAWGPLSSVTTYLFWDMDRFSGVVTRGTTTLEPVVSLLTPQNPVTGQNWFDLNVNKMKVWKSSTSAWVEVIRVFAGRTVGSTITAYNDGTQVGLNTPVTAGYIMLDTLLNPLRKSNGEFLTSSEPSYVKTTSSTSGVLVQPVNKVITVKAAESIPRMSLVYFSAADTVRLASSNPALMPNRVPVGMVIDQLNIGDQGTVVVGGEISYDQWDWSATPGAALYVTTSGQVTTTRPAGLMAYRVGFIKNANTIIFNVDAETSPQVYTAESNQVIISGISPVSTTDGLNGLGERVVTIDVSTASATSPGLLSASNFSLLNSFDSRVVSVEEDIADLALSKANAIHEHNINEVLGLQAALDSKAPVIHTHLSADITDLQPLLNARALAVHEHFIPEVTGLQTALNQKAFSTHLNEFDEIFETVTRASGMSDVGSGATLASVLSSKSDVGHQHGIVDVINLSAELANRAFAVHNHTIAQVTGLPAELNSKAAVVHTHSVGDVVGLSEALQIKSNVGHIHTFDDVPGLQGALDGKAAITHVHVIDDVGGLQVALDGKAASTHLHVISNITGLQIALDGKAASTHLHIIDDVTGLQLALDLLETDISTKAPVIHTHTISQVNDLQVTLDGKAAITHTHAISEVDGLQIALDGKAPNIHTHVAASITDFSEAVDDRVAALIVPGTNISAVYNDVAGTLTLSSTATATSLRVTDLLDTQFSYAPLPGAVLTYVGGAGPGGGAGDWIADFPETALPIRAFGQIATDSTPPAAVTISALEATGFGNTPSPFPAGLPGGAQTVYPDGSVPDQAGFVDWQYNQRQPISLQPGSSFFRLSQNGFYQANIRALIRFTNTVPTTNSGALQITARNSYNKVIGTAIISDPYTAAQKQLLFNNSLQFEHHLNVTWHFWTSGDDPLFNGYDTITFELRNIVSAATGNVTVDVIGAEASMVVLAKGGARQQF